MGKTLAEHAAYELTKAGMTNNSDPAAKTAAVNTMALVRRFEKMNMNERQAKFVLQAFENICNFLPLTPLTDDPAEWSEFEIQRKNKETGEIETRSVWQSKRHSSVFSEDGGVSYIDQATGNTGQSVSHEDAKKQQEAVEQAEDRRKADEAKKAEQASKPPVANPEVPAAEAPAAEEQPVPKTQKKSKKAKK